MCGVTSCTTSPSVLSSSRKTPCVLGCCGPMLTSISSVRTSNSTIRGSSICNGIVTLAYAACPFFDPLLTPADSVVFQRKLVIFSQRVPHPIFRAQNSPQVRMAGEIDAHQIKGLALVPIGDGPHAGHAGNLGQL